jgi:LDH2 family malate/lactate/ureidoglycolate dehydrogenase
MTPEVLLSVPETERAVDAVFAAAGLRDDHATAVRRCLLFAEVRGTRSHGLARLRPYLERIRQGGINADPAVTVHESGAVRVIDGDGGPGAVIGLAAVDAARAGATRYGIGLACVRNTNHVGALAFYSAELSGHGLVSIVLANADPIMVPPGGRRAVVGSNPIAIGVPGDGHVIQSPLLDMATTAAAHGRLVELHKQGQSIPAGWAVDADGGATTDAAAALAGALLPAAGPKGFGLAFMIDLLSAGLSGGSVGSGIVPVADRFTEAQGCCLMVIAIDPAHAAGGDIFTQADQRLVGAVRRSPPAGDRPPMVPGEPEAERARRITGSGGLAVPEPLYDDLVALFAQWSVDPPAVRRA